MLELIPDLIDDSVVVNVTKSCSHNTTDCSACQDLAVGLHNWLVSHEFRYLILDFQDEKEVCPGFIEEVLQLWKRMRIPFLFAGVMSKPRHILESYNYHARYPIFITPEEAIRTLISTGVDRTAKFEGIEFGGPIPLNRLRQGLRGEGEVGEDSSSDEDVDSDDDSGDDE